MHERGCGGPTQARLGRATGEGQEGRGTGSSAAYWVQWHINLNVALGHVGAPAGRRTRGSLAYASKRRCRGLPRTIDSHLGVLLLLLGPQILLTLWHFRTYSTVAVVARHFFSFLGVRNEKCLVREGSRLIGMRQNVCSRGRSRIARLRATVSSLSLRNCARMKPRR